MRPEKVDRLATVIILTLTGLVGLVLFALLAYLLLSGIPHISWHFLTSSAESFRSGGGIRDQLFNSLYLVVLTLIVSIPLALCAAPHISWHFLTSSAESFRSGGGIRDQLFNSLYLVVLTLIVSIPLALCAAIYLSEYAPDNRWTNLLRLAIEVLSSLPSVVVGLFGYLVFVLQWGLDFSLLAGYAPDNRWTNLLRLAIEVLSSLPSVVVGLFGYLVFVLQWGLDFSLLAGALALTILNLPILTRACEDALRQVPYLQRQAGLGLGMSKWRVTTKIVLPAALPGIITGAILSAGRIFGEAAALIYTAGQSSPAISYTDWNPFSPTSFLNPLRPAETLAVHIWKVNSEGLVPDARAVSNGSVAVLILTILIFNLLARYIGYLIKRRLAK